MITIATYRNLMSAELAKTRLASYDIKAMIADEFSYTLGYGAVIDGVRLQVLDVDSERAKEILSAEEFIELPGDSAVIDESTKADAIDAEAFKEPAASTVSSRLAGWSAWLLFLVGIIFLILGRPADDWSPMHILSGQFILMGEVLILAGLWIAYGRLNTIGENEIPPEERMETHVH